MENLRPQGRAVLEIRICPCHCALGAPKVKFDSLPAWRSFKSLRTRMTLFNFTPLSCLKAKDLWDLPSPLAWGQQNRLTRKLRHGARSSSTSWGLVGGANSRDAGSELAFNKAFQGFKQLDEHCLNFSRKLLTLSISWE